VQAAAEICFFYIDEGLNIDSMTMFSLIFFAELRMCLNRDA
jgi:hypothetical protein